VAFVSRMAASRGLALGRVVEVPVEGLELTRQIYMVYHQRRAATPIQRAFWEYAFSAEAALHRQLP
jgi:DNA-binding transcriptional LysR family regulator